MYSQKCSCTLVLRITIIIFEDNLRQFKEVLKISNEDVASHVANKSLGKLLHPRHSSNCHIIRFFFCTVRNRVPVKLCFLFVSFLIFVSFGSDVRRNFLGLGLGITFIKNFKLTEFVLELIVLPTFVFKFDLRRTLLDFDCRTF